MGQCLANFSSLVTLTQLTNKSYTQWCRFLSQEVRESHANEISITRKSSQLSIDCAACACTSCRTWLGSNHVKSPGKTFLVTGGQLWKMRNTLLSESLHDLCKGGIQSEHLLPGGGGPQLGRRCQVPLHKFPRTSVHSAHGNSLSEVARNQTSKLRLTYLGNETLGLLAVHCGWFEK